MLQMQTFIVPLILCFPGQPVNVRSGFNSKGTNTNLEFEVSGISAKTIPAGNASQLSDKISTFIAVQTTAQLRISGNRQIAVDY